MAWTEENSRKLVDYVIWPAVLGNVLWGAVGEAVVGNVETAGLMVPFVAWLVVEVLRGERDAKWMPGTLLTLQSISGLLAIAVVHALVVGGKADPKDYELARWLLGFFLVALTLNNVYLASCDSKRGGNATKRGLTALICLLGAVVTFLWATPTIAWLLGVEVAVFLCWGLVLSLMKSGAGAQDASP